MQSWEKRGVTLLKHWIRQGIECWHQAMVETNAEKSRGLWVRRNCRECLPQWFADVTWDLRQMMRNAIELVARAFPDELNMMMTNVCNEARATSIYCLSFPMFIPRDRCWTDNRRRRCGRIPDSRSFESLVNEDERNDQHGGKDSSQSSDQTNDSFI